MNLGLADAVNDTYQSYRNTGKRYETTVRENGFESCVNRSRKAKEESAVDSYKKRHPEDAGHVNAQVSAGKKCLPETGLTGFQGMRCP